MRGGNGTRGRIIAIARDLFSRQGYAGTSIADIARELGTTPAALYYHFRSKGEILTALLDSPITAYRVIADGLDREQLTAAEVLAAFIDLTAGTQELAVILDTDPAVLSVLDAGLPRTSREIYATAIATLARPAEDRAAMIRARAALAITKEGTLAALSLGGGFLDPADRAEILGAALRALVSS